MQNSVDKNEFLKIHNMSDNKQHWFRRSFLRIIIYMMFVQVITINPSLSSLYLAAYIYSVIVLMLNCSFAQF
jgi:hypothetical protein